MLGSVTLISLDEVPGKARAIGNLACEAGDLLTKKHHGQGVPSFAEAAERVVEQKWPS